MAPPFCRSRLVVSMSCNMSSQVRVSYDITYNDGTHGTISGTDLIRQIDEANLTQPLTVSLTADQIMAMSLRGVTVHLPQYGIERLFISERYVQRNVDQGSCAISLYPGWQYSYVPIGSENTRNSISGAELAQSLGGVVQVDTSESSLARRVANVERRAGIANAQELGKLLGSIHLNFPITSPAVICPSATPSVLSGINRIQRWSQSKPPYLVLPVFFVSIYSILSRGRECHQE